MHKADPSPVHAFTLHAHKEEQVLWSSEEASLASERGKAQRLHACLLGRHVKNLYRQMLQVWHRVCAIFRVSCQVQTALG